MMVPQSVRRASRCLALVASALVVAPIGDAQPQRPTQPQQPARPQQGARPPAVRVWEDQVVLPTYALGADDINPHFRETSGSIIYPYTMQDRFGTARVDRTYRAVFLENEYLRVMCLPEIGGRIQSVYDKTTGQEMFYRNKVIRPGHIALRGAWVSGGVEWNRGPQGHTVTSFSPVDVLPVQNRDGSAALLIGNTEMNYRTTWQVTLTLHPGQKVLDERIRLANPTDIPASYYFWNNTAFPNTPGTRFIYPMTLGSDHNGTEFFAWPVHEGRDLSWLRNYPEPTSVFGYRVAFDFFGAYDVDRDFGIVAYANHLMLPGKKAWTWGESDAGLAAQSVLTDDDGPYIEVQSGPLPTQADFGLLEPGQEISWQEFWYPVSGLRDGFEYATRDVVVQRHATPTGVRLSFGATRAIPDADLTIERQDGRTERRRVFLSPAGVEAIEVDTASSSIDPGAMRMRLRLTEADGTLLLEYTSPLEIPARQAPDLTPAPVDTLDAQYAAADLLRRQGDRTGAAAAFEAILDADPGHAGALRALGAIGLETGRYVRARELLERSLERDADRGLTWYLLGVARLRLGDLPAARTAAAGAIKRAGTAALGHSLMGRIAAQNGDHAAALDSFTDGLAVGGGDWTRLFDYTVIAAYAAGENDQVRYLAEQAILSGTLRLVPHVIDALASGDAIPAFAQRARVWVGEPEFTFIETSLAFAEMGLYRDAAALLEAACWAAVPPGERRPLPAYYMAYFHAQRGDQDEALHWLEEARNATGEYVFPSRPAALEVLQFALQQDPDDARAHLYLGNLYAGLGRLNEAAAAWEHAVAIDAQLSVAARNLGISAWKLEADLDAATDWLQRAIAARPDDQTLYRDLGRVLTERGLHDNALALLESVGAGATPRRADVTLDLARAYLRLERFDDAITLLETTTLTNREGDTGTRAVFYSAHIGRGTARFESDDHGGALQDFEAALTYPANLNIGQPHRPREARAQYWRGYALDALGRVEAAAEAWRACAAGAPLDDEQVEYAGLCQQRLAGGTR
jgi:tetratricopeptide (TPR) repeat protein